MAAGLDAGRGLKLNGGGFEQYVVGVAAGLDAGRGLKQDFGYYQSPGPGVAAGLDAGRGLKRNAETERPEQAPWRPALMPAVD